MGAGESVGRDDHEDLIKLLYTAVLGRNIEPESLKARTDDLANGASFADMFRDVATSDEARHRRSAPPGIATPCPQPVDPVSLDDRIPQIHDAITLAYTHFLKRKPTIEDLTFWQGAISAGLPVESFLADIAKSEEAALKAGQLEIGAGLSDGQFLMVAGEALFGRGLMPVETVAWQRRLESGEFTRREMVTIVVSERIEAASRPEAEVGLHDADQCAILGTSRMLSRKQWDRKAVELRSRERPHKPAAVPLAERQFTHSGNYVVSMIASLYKGRAFIEKFLDNIVSQTLFDRSELIIVDADSPEGEEEVIEAYRRVYPNIVYKRINYRLGIYDAWNVGVGMARGRYLTNTNLDDLRRRDSIALQAAFLDARDDVDVVYQDFYYSFDPGLDFEEVEAFGFKSELPILTPNNLLMFNSPHNAPMWRKALHGEVGLFDTRYKSAGDYEFWARCVAAGKVFGKINTPHVVYYQNPAGISTRPDTRGIEEARDVLRRYGPRLTRSALLQSRKDLFAGLGIEADRQLGSDGKSYYEIIQAALVDLGAKRLRDREAPARGRDGSVESAEGGR